MLILPRDRETDIPRQIIPDALVVGHSLDDLLGQIGLHRQILLQLVIDLQNIVSANNPAETRVLRSADL